MQTVSRESMPTIIISSVLFFIGLVGGYCMTAYDPLTVILCFGVLLAISLIIAWFTIVKPAQYINVSLAVKHHPTEDTIRLRWSIENKSEVMVKVYRYRVQTTNDKGFMSPWRDHDYDVFVKPKGMLGSVYDEDSFVHVPPSEYEIQENVKNVISVILYYKAADGKEGFVMSEVEVDKRSKQK